MVCALLDNRKTATRRAVKPQPKLISAQDGFGPLLQIKDKGVWFKNDPNHVAPYQSGDILYVRETWAENAYDGSCFFKADGKCEVFSWRPSIHMPREAARIFLRVTDVRVERLQDMGHDDAEQEGCWCDEEGGLAMPLDKFSYLWDSTIKPADRALYGWEANPWVWVIEFERISRKEALSDV